MKCPHCAHSFALTWDKYFSSFFGHHTCPACGKRFKIILSVSYFLLLCAIALVAGGTPAIIAFFLSHNFWYTIAAYLLFGFGIVVPFDRYMANTFRPVKPIH
jgi:hypothetical protein